ncbi:hypothetical protein GJ496_002289 [Pomphorhynchus laevis]|nr:hypothetical protein GJ496_002289 [Pomphorhynchus laevis]
MGGNYAEINNLFKDVPNHAVIEMSTKFVCFPAPDCDADKLFTKTISALKNSNKVCDAIWARFMDYTKAIDVIVACSKYGDAVALHEEPGIKFIGSKVHHDICEGRVNTLPDELVGKVWIQDFFQFDYKIENWFWDVGDVTHILPDTNCYISVSAQHSLGRTVMNELLYAIKYAPILGLKYTPSDIRTMIRTGIVRVDMPLVIAAKSENTKPDTKDSRNI